MKYVRISIFSVVFIFLLIAGYLSWANLSSSISPNPCESVVYYSVSKFDDRFEITKEDFLLELQQAENVWEKAAGKNLFEYTDEPNKNTLLVNLIYDYRQNTTKKLNQTGGTIEENRNRYDETKKRYDSFLKKYNIDKSSLDTKISSYNVKKKTHDEEIDYWNEQGGAPTEKYRELEELRRNLNDQADSISNEQKLLNSLTLNINELAKTLNELSKKINEQVEGYNHTLNKTGEEFSEGEYQNDKDGVRINVYQFENKNVLGRLLIHEFGHAIGLDHVDNKDAIMYRLNQSKNSKLTNEDLDELLLKCSLPN